MSPDGITEYTVTVTDDFDTTSGIVPSGEGSATVFVNNCDIDPGYGFFEFKSELCIGAELESLLEDPTGGEFSEFLYRIQDNRVRIRIVWQGDLSSYNDFKAFLISEFGLTGFIVSESEDLVNNLRTITCDFEIPRLPELCLLDINQVYPYIPPPTGGETSFTGAVLNEAMALSETTLISQGDVAQNSDLARLGWGLSGAGLKIGVISDSFNKLNNGYQKDQDEGELPPGIQAVDLTLGGTDEGRAMLQLIHDVAPAAELFFDRGFESTGYIAAQ